MTAQRTEFSWWPMMIASGCLGLMVGATGCETKPKGPPTVPVSGTVLHQGQPLAEASVVFYPADGNATVKPAQAVTDGSGKYQVKTFVSAGNYQDGMETGDYIVTVSKTQAQPPGVMMPPIELLPVQYTQPQTSPLRWTVPAGGGEFPIEIK